MEVIWYKTYHILQEPCVLSISSRLPYIIVKKGVTLAPPQGYFPVTGHVVSQEEIMAIWDSSHYYPWRMPFCDHIRKGVRDLRIYVTQYKIVSLPSSTVWLKGHTIAEIMCLQSLHSTHTGIGLVNDRSKKNSPVFFITFIKIYH